MPACKERMPMILIIFMVITACNANSGRSFLPHVNGYADNNREVFILQEELLEISGLSHIKNNTIAAINDEEGVLFIADISNDSLTSFPFSDEGDYEEVVKTDTSFFV